MPGSYVSLRWLGVAIAILAFHALVDVRLAPSSIAVVAPWLAVFFLILAVYISTRMLKRNPLLAGSKAYWMLTWFVVSYLLATHIAGIIASALSPGTLRTVTGMHLARSVGVTFTVVYVGGLKPDKAWLLVLVGIAPLILLQPLLVAIPGSWESLHTDAFVAAYSLEAPICAAMAVLALVGSLHAGAALASSHEMMAQLEDRAGETEALLEAAMPPFVARALLADTPPEALSRFFESATIAFVCLEDYAGKLESCDPREVMRWLDKVYVAFDNVVDAYGERVNKVEVVANTYVLSTGLPIDDPDHVVVMCAFAADLLALCADVPGVGPVRVRIGIHCGPVGAGVIGHSRRFYRVFGDTVNMASRMMSTGQDGRVHLSAAAAAAVEAMCALGPPAPLAAANPRPPAAARVSSSHAPPDSAVSVALPPLPLVAAAAAAAATTAAATSGHSGLQRAPALSQASSSARSLQSAAGQSCSSQASGRSFPQPPMAQQQPPTPRRPGLPFSVALRGKTFVKGKGNVDTYWLVVHHQLLPQQQPPRAGGQGFHAFHGGESSGPESPRTACAASAEAPSDGDGDAAPGSAVPASGSHGSSVRRSLTYVVCHGTPPLQGGAPWTSIIPLPSPRDPLPAAAAGAASWPPFSLLSQNVSSSYAGAAAATADDSARSAATLARKPAGAAVLAQHYLVKAQSGAPAGTAVRAAAGAGGVGSGVFSAGSGTVGGVGSHSYRDGGGGASSRGVLVSVRPLLPIAPPASSRRRRSTRVIIDASGSLHNVSSGEGSGVYTAGLPGTVPADAGSQPRTPAAAAAAVVVLPPAGGSPGLPATPRLTSQCFLQPIAYEGVGGDAGVRALRPPFRVSDASSTGTAGQPPGVVPSSDPHPGALSVTTLSQPAFSPSIAAAAVAAAAATAGGAAAGTVASGSVGASVRSPATTAPASAGGASDQMPRIPLLSVPLAPRAPAPALSAGRGGARRIAATLSLLRTSLEAGGGAVLSPTSPTRMTASPLSSSAGTSGAPLTIQERVALAKLSGSGAARRSSWVERSYSRNNFEGGDASSPATGGRDRISVDVEAMSRVGTFLASAVTGVHSELRSRTATREHAFTGMYSEPRSRTATREHHILGGIQSDRTRTATREHHTVLTEVDPEAEVPVFTGQSQPEKLVGVDIAVEQQLPDDYHFDSPRATAAQPSGAAAMACDTLWDSLLYALSHEPFADPDAEAGLQTELLNHLVAGSLLLASVVCVTVVAAAVARGTLRGAVTEAAQASWVVMCVALLAAALGLREAWARRGRIVRWACVRRGAPAAATSVALAGYVAVASLLLRYSSSCGASGEGCRVDPADLSTTNAVTANEALLWDTSVLVCAGLAALTLRIDVRFVAARLAASILVDVVWAVLRGRRLGASPDATAISFATLIAFHVVAFGGAVTGERMARTRFAIHRALEAAVRDRRALLDDLFPPAVVQSLLAGDPVPPLVSEGAVVLFCDFAGFTRMSSELQPFEVMRAMDTVYSAFDRLVEDAARPDDALWKVETVGDAYIVLGGVDRNTGIVLVPATAELRTRYILERVFALAHALQAEIGRLRDELGLPLHARMGVHVGDIVSGIVGSRRPRFCVLGPALLAAERAEAAGTPDGLACTSETQSAYLSSTYRFVAKGSSSAGGEAATGGYYDVLPLH